MSSESKRRTAAANLLQLSLFPVEEVPSHRDVQSPPQDSDREDTLVSEHAPWSSAEAGGAEAPAATARRVSVRPQATRLKDAIQEYTQYLVALNRAKHTILSFGLDLNLLLKQLGDVTLTQIGERDLRAFINWIRTEQHNSPVSVRRKVASLKNFFSYLHREGAIPSDPSLRLIYPQIFPPLPEFLEEGQVADLLAVASEHLSWQALILLMLETGLKRDEVVALDRSDINLGEAEIQQSYLVVRETQNAKRLRSRRLEIGPETASVLRRFVAEEPPQESFFGFSPRGVNFIVETCGYRAHIATRGKKLTPQILRATFAVRHMRDMVRQEEALRAAGASEEILARVIAEHDIALLRLLGLHEEPESAQKYRKLVHGWSSHVQPPG